MSGHIEARHWLLQDTDGKVVVSGVQPAFCPICHQGPIVTASGYPMLKCPDDHLHAKPSESGLEGAVIQWNLSVARLAENRTRLRVPPPPEAVEVGGLEPDKLVKFSAQAVLTAEPVVSLRDEWAMRVFDVWASKDGALEGCAGVEQKIIEALRSCYTIADAAVHVARSTEDAAVNGETQPEQTTEDKINYPDGW